MNQKQREKYEKIMVDFSEGKLFSASGKKVTDPEMAAAIASSEAGLSDYKRRLDDKDVLRIFGMIPENGKEE